MKKLFLLLISLYVFHISYSQTEIPKAQCIFIYNFTRLIEWPESFKNGDFVIGVFGNSEVYGELEAYTAGKKVAMQNIVVKKIKDLSEIDNCHILFVSYNKTSSMPDILKKTESNPTLVIGERKNIINEGAGIGFVLIEDKLKFELNLPASTRNGLKINSKLQEMALNVKK
jgi:YfiR/HmsC-like